MPPDERAGAGDWSFPPVEPVELEPVEPLAPYLPVAHDGAYATPSAGLQDAPAPDAPPPLNLDVPRRTPATGDPVSPGRALAGAAVAVAGVLLGVGALLWATEAPGGDPSLQASQAQRAGSPVSAPPTAVASATPTATAEPAPLPPSPAVVVRPSPTHAAPVAVPKLPLTVLNNSTRPLLADRAARQFRAAGWPIKLTGNFRGRVAATTAYYEPGQLRSARLLQRMFPGITRVRPRFDGLPGSGLTVVLTRSYDA